MIKLPVKGDCVDIHMISGVMARGVVESVNKEELVLGMRPTIHRISGGSDVFEKITVRVEDISMVGYRE